jgi:hypothetical protein
MQAQKPSEMTANSKSFGTVCLLQRDRKNVAETVICPVSRYKYECRTLHYICWLHWHTKYRREIRLIWRRLDKGSSKSHRKVNTVTPLHGLSMCDITHSGRQAPCSECTFCGHLHPTDANKLFQQADAYPRDYRVPCPAGLQSHTDWYAAVSIAGQGLQSAMSRGTAVPYSLICCCKHCGTGTTECHVSGDCSPILTDMLL